MGVDIKKYKYVFLLLLFSFTAKPQLVINEVSQGYTGNQEYVELLVVGTPTCNSIPCMDLRGYYLDDNNGNHGTGSGVGIAQGCVRFTTDPLWQCVPVGTLILIYNDADLNPDVPAQDLSLTDGNCKLVIPISNCTLFEKNTSTPTTTTSTYPTTGFTPCGNWTNISMANGGDSFQTIDPAGSEVFSVSWGNNTLSNIIYFAVNQTAMVCSMTNSTDNNPSTQSNWVCQTVTGNQTPGSPNNPANAAWINSMNNSCTALTPLAANASVTNAGCTCTGSATVTAGGAIAPYNYFWSTGDTTTNVSALCPGTYSVTVSSANGCSQTTTLTIISISPITTTVTTTNVSCHGGSNGSATITASNTSGPVTYSWNPAGGNSAGASGLTAGNYTVNILDSVGCTATQTVLITQPSSLTATAMQTNVLCNASSNGVASINASGGTGPYSYTWSPTGGNSASANNLAAGNYTVTVADANGCSLSQTYTLTQPPALTLTINNTKATCGNNNGNATGFASGGVSPYTYTWSPTGGNAANASGLAVGSYTLDVTDANNCAITATTSIVNIGGASVTATSTSVSCNGGNDGTASATATGGAGQYSYVWSPSGGNAANASGLSAGVYTIAVSDSVGCVSWDTTTVTQPPVLSVGIISTNVSCFGGNNGSASTVFVTGGTGAYTYSWSTGNTSASITGLTAGNYSVSVTDANGCTTTTSTAVTQPSILNMSINTTSVTCNGGNNGSATSNVTGGTAPYTYTWQPSGGNASSANNLIAGAYTVNVNDAHGCAQTATCTISEPTSLTVSVSNTQVTCGVNNGTASAIVSGGTSPYTYSWSPAGGSGSNANNLASGVYTVTVTDNNNCVQSVTTTITSASTMTLSATATPAICNGAANGSATVNVNGGNAPYTYTWSPGGGNTTSATNLTAGNYTVAVTDGNNCTLTTTISVTQPPALSLTVASVTVCNGQTSNLTANASGGNAPYSYSWNGGSAGSSNTFSATTASATVVTVVVTDNNSCPAASANATITVLPPLQVSTGDLLLCAGANGVLSATASGGNGNYSYSWMPGNLSGSSVSVTGQSATIYTVTVSDGCTVSSASDTGLVSVISVPTVTLLPTISGCVPLCVNFTVGSSATITGYQWDFGDNSSSALQNPAHCYTAAGVYNVALSYTTSQGCNNTVISNGMVNAFGQPHAAFAASAYESTILNPQIFFYDQSGSNVTNWNWNFGDGTISSQTDPAHAYTAPGDYQVYLVVTNQQGCKDSVTVEILIKEDFTFYAPNAFTPDGDDDNELFLPRGIGWDNSRYKLWIYDRWGNLVLSTTDVDKGWDGTRHGASVQQDVYVWEVELHDLYGGPHKFSGTVSLIR